MGHALLPHTALERRVYTTPSRAPRHSRYPQKHHRYIAKQYLESSARTQTAAIHDLAYL